MLSKVELFKFAQRGLWTFGLVLLMPCAGLSQNWPAESVALSQQLLNETMSSTMSKIPKSMIANASGVAIIPNVIKGGFIIGARFGRGVLMVRDPNGVWHAPVFITLTGGNVGWQAGLKSSDVLLVFKTPRSIQGILSGKLTLGAGVSAAAGPVGGEGAVATDGQLQAEIYTYSRSRGLFAGVAIDGSMLQIDRMATAAYYSMTTPNSPAIVPPAAQQLTESVAGYAEAIARGTPPSAGYAQQLAASESEVIRGELVQLAPKLFDLLDDSWKEYLGLPPSFLGHAPPDPVAVKEVVARYGAIASDPRFVALSSRPEFQSVYALLKHYEQTLGPAVQGLQLPPPPPIGLPR